MNCSKMMSRLTGLLCGIALCTSVSTPSQASLTKKGWWDGDWTCSIDGRPARMRWRVVDATTTSCDGEICSTVAGSRYKGRFSDNGSPWVSLTHAKHGNNGGLYFKHADGNQWYLPQPTAGRTIGWTTWNGSRYKLSCRR
jgi:hypothetical protein